MDYRYLGENIQIIRKLRGMTQQELADKIGINLQSLSKIERGVNYPAFETLDKIVNFLGVTPNELLDGEWENTSHMEQAVMRVLKREENFNVELAHLKAGSYFEREEDQQEYELQKLRDYISGYINLEKRSASELQELKKLIQVQKLQKVLDRYDELHSVDLYDETSEGHKNINPYDEEILHHLTDEDEKFSVPEIFPIKSPFNDED